MVQSSGGVILVEDYVDVPITLYNLTNLRKLLRSHEAWFQDTMPIVNNVVGQAKRTKNITNEQNNLFQAIKYKVQLIRQELQFVLNHISWDTIIEHPHAHSRTKRGLFDLGGHILGGIFGLATAEDMAQVNVRLDNISHILYNQGKVLTTQNKVMNSLVNSYKTLAHNIQLFSPVLNKVRENIHNMFIQLIMAESLNNILLAVRTLSQAVHRTFKIIQDVQSGIVTPDLLSPHQLQAVLRWSGSVKELTPVFREEELQFYYSILTATVTSTFILIHIPFRSADNFLLYRISPFPFMLNGSLYTIRDVKPQVLISQDYMTVAYPSERQIHNCHSTVYHLRLCTAAQFTLLPAVSDPCALALVRDSSVELHCSFTNFKPNFVYHQHVHLWQFFYFHNKTDVTVKCPGAKASSNVVQGFYVVQDSCSTTSRLLQTLPSRHLKSLRNYTTDTLIPLPSFPSLNITNVKLIPLQLEELPELSTLSTVDSSWSEIHPQIVYPSLGIMFTVLLTICVLAGLYTCIMKKRHNELRQAVMTTERDPTTTQLTAESTL